MKHNTKIKHGRYLTLAFTLLFLACGEEPLYNGGDILPPVPEGKVRIGLYTNSNDFQQPVSRAAIDENSVTGVTDRMPWVFVFSGTGASATFVEVKQSAPLGDPVVPHVVLSKHDNPVEMLLLANAPDWFYDGSLALDFSEANLAATLSGTTLSEASALLRTIDIAASSAIPYNNAYLPMVGGLSLPDGINNTTAVGSNDSKVEMTRVVAKVTVAESADNFTLDHWTVIGAKRHTLFFDATAAAGNLMDFDDATVDGGESNPFYLYASAVGETAVIVKGTYNGIANQYYKLALKDAANGNPISIQRNNWYKLKVITVNMPGHASLEAAKAAVPTNDIVAVVSVVDLNAHDVTDNGDYYLGLSNSQLLFYGLPESAELPYTAVTVSTDATATAIGGVNSVALSNVVGRLTLATTALSLSADGVVPGITDIKFSTVGSDFTSARIVIRLGALTRIVEVYKASDGLTFVGGGTKLDFQGNDIYTTANLASPAEALWLSFSPDGVNDVGGNYVQPDVAALTPIYLHAPDNIAKNGAVSRSGEVFLSRIDDGRAKVYVRQLALNAALDCSATVVHGNYRSEQELDDSHFIRIKIKSNTLLTGYNYNVGTTQRNRIYFQTIGTFGTDAELNDGVYEYTLDMKGYGTLYNEGGPAEVYSFLLPILSSDLFADTCLTNIKVGY